MDLGGMGGAVAPHLADLFHTASMMPGRPVFLVQDLEKRIQPLVNMVERLAQFAAAVSTMLRTGSHGFSIAASDQATIPISAHLVFQKQNSTKDNASRW
jgi:hypothetical protein